MPMKNKTPSLVPLRTEFHRDFKEFFPVAHGTLSLVRKAVENGRILEERCRPRTCCGARPTNPDALTPSEA